MRIFKCLSLVFFLSITFDMTLHTFVLPENRSIEFLCSTSAFAQSSPKNKQDTLPHEAGKCFRKAQTLIQQGKLHDAIKVMESFQKKGKGASPEDLQKNGYDHYYLDYMLGNTWMMLAEADGNKKGGSTSRERRAAGYYAQALKKKSDLAPAWLNLANCLYTLGEMAEAAEAFIKGYDFSPESEKRAEQLYYGSICYFQAGGKKNQKKAYETFKKLIKRHPEKISLAWTESYVNILLAIDYKKTALPHIETLARKYQGEKKSQWQEILLYHYLNMKMEKKALAFARELTQADPTEAKWWKVRCHIHLDQGNLVQGLKGLLIYSFLTPLKKDEAKLLADLYLSVGIPAEAVDRYEKMLKSAFDQEVASRMVNGCQVSAQPKKAIAWIDRMIEATPNDATKRKDLIAHKRRIEDQLDRELGYRQKIVE